jgi:hypothetical protein
MKHKVKIIKDDDDGFVGDYIVIVEHIRYRKSKPIY